MLIIYALSVIDRVSLTLWSVTSIPRPFVSDKAASFKLYNSDGVDACNGSSNNMNVGLVAIVLAISPPPFAA